MLFVAESKHGLVVNGSKIGLSDGPHEDLGDGCTIKLPANPGTEGHDGNRLGWAWNPRRNKKSFTESIPVVSPCEPRIARPRCEKTWADLID